MLNVLRFFSALLLISGLTLEINAQANSDNHLVNICVPEVAILDIEAPTSTTIKLEPTAPTDAGLALDFTGATNSELWLNYSSIVGTTTASSRKVTVAITSMAVPQGLQLAVLAGAATATGDGTKGSSAGSITLSTSEQDVITGIGSCYTGNGINNGHNLTYTLSQVGNYSDLDFDDQPQLTITYTLTAN